MGPFVGIAFVALCATAATVGLRTGSLAPYYPSVNRDQAPLKFWLVIGTCGVVAAVNIFNLFRNH